MEGKFYYSSPDATLFFISNGYDDGTSMLDVIMENMKDAERRIRELQPKNPIYTDVVRNSVWCKHKRVYWVQCNNSHPLPNDVLRLASMGMWEFIDR